jgi:hypothetical protein
MQHRRKISNSKRERVNGVVASFFEKMKKNEKKLPGDLEPTKTARVSQNSTFR